MPKTVIKTIALRILLIGGVFGLAMTALTLRGETPGITFATSGIDLKIDSRGFYNGVPVPALTWYLKNLNPTSDKFFNFNDVKPGDYGKTIISMHVKKSAAWLCLDFKNLKDNDNGVNEPESEEDLDGNTGGELSDALEFFAWRDDGDNIFEVGEKPVFGTSTQMASSVLDDTTYIVGDSKQGGACGIDQTRYVGIYWCMGNLSVNTATAQISCDGSALGNETQTDSMTVDMSIRAMPSKENPKFVCGGNAPKPPHPKPKPPHHGGWNPPHHDNSYKPNINYNHFSFPKFGFGSH